MVHVAHDGDHGRPGCKSSGVLFHWGEYFFRQIALGFRLHSEALGHEGRSVIVYTLGEEAMTPIFMSCLTTSVPGTPIFEPAHSLLRFRPR